MRRKESDTGMRQKGEGPSPKSLSDLSAAIPGLQAEPFLEGPLGSRVGSSCSLAVWYPIPGPFKTQSGSSLKYFESVWTCLNFGIQCTLEINNMRIQSNYLILSFLALSAMSATVRKEAMPRCTSVDCAGCGVGGRHSRPLDHFGHICCNMSKF